VNGIATALIVEKITMDVAVVGPAMRCQLDPKSAATIVGMIAA